VLLLIGVISNAQGTHFPYDISVQTIQGDCFNNCQAVISLSDSQGNIIIMDDSLHHPVDSVSYPIYTVQYHYKNQMLNSVFYSYDHILTLDAGVYSIGVSAYIMTQVGNQYVPILVDTTLYGISLVSTYQPLNASTLAIISPNNSWYNGQYREECGNRHSISCQDVGRVQLKITSGIFPYTIYFINSQQDTIVHAVFENRQHSGTDSLYADYMDYYTFDSLPASSYRIVVRDACSYTIVLHYTVEENNVFPNHLYFLSSAPNPIDSNIVKFRANFYHSHSLYNYDNEVLGEMFQYRFINPNLTGGYDTTAWHDCIDNSSNSFLQYFSDTLYDFNSYCELYGKSIRFEMRDLCQQDTQAISVTIAPPDSACFTTFSDVMEECVGQTSADTCALICDTLLRNTGSHTIYYNCPLYNGYNSSDSQVFFYSRPLTWAYVDSASGQTIKMTTINDINEHSSLTHEDVENIYGLYNHLSLPIIRTLYDANGCILYSRFDTLEFIKDTTSLSMPSSWTISTNFDRYHYSSCFENEREITIYENLTPFPLYRDSVIIRLIQSPLYNKFNFSAIFHNGEWTIVKEDSTSNFADITAEGMSVTISHNRLSGGRYVFICETICGIDTLQVDIDGIYYYEWEWLEEPVYSTEQECNDLYVTPIAGKYRKYSYLIDPTISNDEPIVTTNDYFPSISLISGEVGGYSATSTSMFSPIKFTIPGDYVMRMRFYGCGEMFFIDDTIHFVRILIDFEKAYAVVCDSVANIGSVIVRAINGSTPYTYTLYSQPDLHGTVLGSNTNGLFYNVNITIGQEVSVFVIDSCESNYSINLVAMSLEQSQLLWFNGNQPTPGACVGDTLYLEALPFNQNIGYVWTGPGNFTASSQEANYYVADTNSQGWISVELLNTGCQNPIRDSLFLNVFTPPQITISSHDTVCVGDTAWVEIISSGSGTIHGTLFQSSAGEITSSEISALNNDTLLLPVSIYANSYLWADNISDHFCPLRTTPDSISIDIHPLSPSSDSSLINTYDQLVCYGDSATLLVTANMSTPTIINWYEDLWQTNLLHHDSILNANDNSTYTIPQLTTDTTLFVIAWNQQHCPSLLGRVDYWLNMQNGQTTMQQGEGVRLFDSGGGNNPYSNGENFTHTFNFTNTDDLLIRFVNFNVCIGDTLFLYGEDGTLICFFTDTILPNSLIIHGSSLSVKFVSNQLNVASGWCMEILSSISMATVSADVVQYADTFSVDYCQNISPVDHLPFTHVDISEEGLFKYDTILLSTMGCDSSITLFVNVLPNSSFNIDTIICQGESYKLGDKYYFDTGDYTASFTSSNGCDSAVSLHLQVIDNTIDLASSEIDFCDNYSTLLMTPIAGDSYHWSTGESTPSIEVTSPGVYTVTMYYEGCYTSGRYIIKPCEFDLFLPNAITPGNGDGLNDYFCLQDRQKFLIDQFEIYIYNRWGILVYYSENKDFKWYGGENNNLYSDDNVYNYVIFLTDREKRKYSYKGSIVVLQ